MLYKIQDPESLKSKWKGSCQSQESLLVITSLQICPFNYLASISPANGDKLFLVFCFDLSLVMKAFLIKYKNLKCKNEKKNWWMMKQLRYANQLLMCRKTNCTWSAPNSDMTWVQLHRKRGLYFTWYRQKGSKFQKTTTTCMSFFLFLVWTEVDTCCGNNFYLTCFPSRQLNMQIRRESTHRALLLSSSSKHTNNTIVESTFGNLVRFIQDID